MSPLEKNLLLLIEDVLAESQIFLGEKGKEAIAKCLRERVKKIAQPALLEELIQRDRNP